MTEFWEDAFIKKQEMWGFVPALSALHTNDFFIEKYSYPVLVMVEMHRYL
jgi:hypothetical protein